MTRGRLSTVVLLVVSLLATALLRDVTYRRHDRLVWGNMRRPENRLAGLSSFALGLVLGGLRGPLVMILWTSSENQKTNRDLEDFDTKIDLIRQLQPEFDSVHIFQIWNKGYNIVAQISSMPNKYATILGAIDYGRSIDEQRPDNINILVSIADLYFNKLGNSAEKRYYISRFREDTLPREEKTTPRQQGLPRRRADVLLDKDGYILPRFINAPQDQYRAVGGGELAYLARWNTRDEGGFPYGVSPLAVGYAYYRRASEIASTTGRRHLYLSENVLDSRGPISLKFWADEEHERARRAEIRAVGKPVPEDRNAMEKATADLKIKGAFPDTSANTRAAVAEALFSLKRTASVAAQSAEEHRRHIENPNYLTSADYRAHMQDARALSVLTSADHDYLLAAAARAGFTPPLADPAEADAALKRAAEQYTEARRLFYLQLLKYYIEDEVVVATYPAASGQPGANKATIEKIDPALYPRIYQATRDYIKQKNMYDMHREDTLEYESYIARVDARLASLAAAVAADR